MRMEKRIWFFIALMWGCMSLIHGRPKFIKGGFEFEVLYDGSVLVSRARTVYKSQEPMEKEFHIPASVEHEGKTYKVQGVAPDGFSGCAEIRHLVVDEGVSTFGDNAFGACINLETVKLPASAGYGRHMFVGCRNLKSIVVDPDNDFIDSRDCCNAIIDTELDKLVVACPAATVPSSVKSIGEEAFAYCHGMKEIRIPEGVREIGKWAFDGCVDLEHVILPRSLKSIGEAAFCGCESLKSLYIPENVEQIDAGEYPGLFWGCHSLSSVVVDRKNSFYDSRRNCNAIIETGSLKLIAGCAVSRLVEGVECIGGYAFAGTQIREIHIPESMTLFSVNAFDSCDALSRITVHKDNPVYSSPDSCNAIIRRDSAVLVLGCAASSIPNGVKRIGKSAFSAKPLLKNILFLPDGLEAIEDGAFARCPNLFEVVIPHSVTSIGEFAFTQCPQLAIVQMSGGVKELQEYVFMNCNKLAVIDFPEGISVIRSYAFDGCGKLNHVVFPSSLTLIEDGAFSGCPCEEDIKKLNLH